MTGMSEEGAVHVVVRILEAAVTSPSDGAQIFLESTSDEGDGFTVLCGLAKTISAIATKGQDYDGRHLVVDHRRVDGAREPTEVEELVASDVAAFIAAVGNDDYRGAARVFDEACCSRSDVGFVGERGGRFISQLIGMAGATVAFEIGKGQDR